MLLQDLHARPPAGSCTDLLGRRSMVYGSLFATVVACQAPTPAPRDDPPASASQAPHAKPTPSVASTAPVAPPLEGAWIETLDLGDGKTALVCPPLGAREPRPVIVAAHGYGDRPEWACGGWRLASLGEAFVVCPRGTPTRSDKFAWSSGSELVDRVRRVFPALEQRFGGRIRQHSAIYAGFSQGANLAADVLRDNPERFQAAIFAEGGYSTLRNERFAQSFRANGGKAVMVVCGGSGCFAEARASQRVLERAGLRVMVSGDARAGHNLNQRMQLALQHDLLRFVVGLPGWANMDSGTRARAQEGGVRVRQGLVPSRPAFAFTEIDVDLAAMDVVITKLEGGASLETLMPKEALVTLNGGFFGPDFRPSAWLRSAGRDLAAPKDTTRGGVFAVNGSRLYVGPRASLPFEPTTAIQNRPLLVELDGSLGIHSDDGRRANRTVACSVNGALRFVVLTAPLPLAPTLRETAELLRIPRPAGFGCSTALNLDGGPSTGVLFASELELDPVLPATPIGYAVAIVPRRRR